MRHLLLPSVFFLQSPRQGSAVFLSTFLQTTSSATHSPAQGSTCCGFTDVLRHSSVQTWPYLPHTPRQLGTLAPCLTVIKSLLCSTPQSQGTVLKIYPSGSQTHSPLSDLYPAVLGWCPARHPSPLSRAGHKNSV